MSRFRSQENGVTGEARSHYLLSRDFWLLRRSVDAAAVDFIVQRKRKSSDEDIRSSQQVEEIAFVQSKYIGPRSSAKVAHDYLDGAGRSRPGFFVFVHSHDSSDNSVDWFFSGQEVLTTWRRSADGAHYRFGSIRDRAEAGFARRKRGEICRLIESAMGERRFGIFQLVTSNFFETYSNVRSLHEPCGTYLLSRTHGCACAFYRNLDGGVLPLDYRRDAYNYSGFFEWGYSGSGPHFLAHSLLVHFLCGRRPAAEEVTLLVEFLISRLSPGSNHEVSGDMILIALSAAPFNIPMAEHRRRELIEFARKKVGLTGGVNDL